MVDQVIANKLTILKTKVYVAKFEILQILKFQVDFSQNAKNARGLLNTVHI